MARQMVVNYGFSDIGPWNLQVGRCCCPLEWWLAALPASPISSGCTNALWLMGVACPLHLCQ